MKAASISQLRLLQLVSPSLPVGAFTYSQGLEWAVEEGWVNSQTTLQGWIADALRTSMTYLEVPVYKRLYTAYRTEDFAAAGYWVDYLLASRETSELKLEEQQRGRALARLLPALGCTADECQLQQIEKTQLAGFAWATVQWEIEPVSAVRAYVWGWLENITLAGVKLIPLGQTAGQQIIFELGEQVDATVQRGNDLGDAQIGFSCCAQALASAFHETQYTRLYRS